MFRYLFISLSLFLIVLYIVFDKEVESKEINLGLSIPNSGIMKASGKAVYAGADAYFSYVNEYNLLDKKINLIVYDDNYEPELTKENILKLLQKDVFAFFGFVGTPTIKKVLPILKNSDIPFIAPISGASFLREGELNNFINLRSSYKDEIMRITNYLHGKKSIDNFAIFYQNDDYGEEGFVSLIDVLSKSGLKLVGEGTYKRNTLSIKHALYEISQSKPQAVILMGAYKANALFIQRARKNKKFKDTIFCNISFADANEVVKDLNQETKNVLFSQIVPNFNDNSSHIILEYKRLMRRYSQNEPLSFISLESFLAAKMVVDALQKTEGRLTREKFLKEIRLLNEENKKLRSKVYLFKYENSKFIEVDGEN